MDAFLDALNAPFARPPLVTAALAHLRFLTLHPFDDGNGRLARALNEWLLARAERSALRFYSLSAQIQLEKDAYYEALERAQRGGSTSRDGLRGLLDAMPVPLKRPRRG